MPALCAFSIDCLLLLPKMQAATVKLGASSSLSILSLFPDILIIAYLCVCAPTCLCGRGFAREGQVFYQISLS